MRDKKLMLLIGLSILALFSLVYGIVTPSKSRRGVLMNAVSSPKEGTALLGTIDLAGRRAKRTSYETWGRNPFLLKESSTQRSSHLVLNGIVWDEKIPRAVVNDRIVEVGDTIDGNRVMTIEPNRVILNDGFNNFELRLGRKN